jgi:Rrf2 family protein
MFSQTVEYALRAIVALAYRHDEPSTSQQLAEFTRVPAPYLSKIMQSLVRTGIVNSQRGLRGGFRLAIAPDELTLWQVVDAVDPVKRITSCPLDIASHGARLCALHRRLDNAMGMVEDAFRDTTIAQVLAEQPHRKPLCEIQPVQILPRRRH